MKAFMHLFLKEDHSFNGIYDGTITHFTTCLYQTGQHHNDLKVAILLAASKLIDKDGLAAKLNEEAFELLAPETTQKQ